MIDYAPSCDGCREIYRERKPPEDPHCGTCREVAFEENEDAIGIFFLVKNQLIMGFSGPIDIRHQAIHEAMRLYGVRNRRRCFEKVLILSKWWLKAMNSQQDVVSSMQ